MFKLSSKLINIKALNIWILNGFIVLKDTIMTQNLYFR